MPFSGGDPGRLVTLREAADALGVSVRTVRRFIGYGYLEGFRVGPRAVRVRAGDVNALVRRLPGGYAGTLHPDDEDDDEDDEGKAAACND